jgi:hypothetical protein
MVRVVRAEDLLTRADLEAFRVDFGADIERAFRRATVNILAGMVAIDATLLAVAKLL